MSTINNNMGVDTYTRIGEYSTRTETLQQAKQPSKTDDVTISEKGSTNSKKVEGDAAENAAIDHAVEIANQRLKPTKTEIQYSYHEATKQIAFKLTDKETGDVIREIPSEDVLDMLEKMWELAGILIDKKS